MNADDFLDVAETLLSSGSKRVYIRRAVSTTYYALFHSLATCCANTLVGTGAHHNNNRDTWRDTYRALEHGHARSQCQHASRPRFTAPVIDFARLFVAMQTKRHEADYDPYAYFYKSECLGDLTDVRHAIGAFEREPLPVRRGFSAYVLIKKRR